jgi:hypothetical protein
MHLDVLTDNQRALLPLVRRFRRSFYLVGGTAIALHIGHRRSVDFDLFTRRTLAKSRIRSVLDEYAFPWRRIHEESDQFHILCHGVKITFFSYPYDVPHGCKAGGFMTMPALLSLAAMEAFALGRRAKWKDYVDLFFILRDHCSIAEINIAASGVFGDEYSEQLAYYEDIDYTEAVEYAVTPVANEIVKRFLTDEATRIL